MAAWPYSVAEFRTNVVRQALLAIDHHSPQAEVLVLGTALAVSGCSSLLPAESGLRATRQYGGGPALGYFQMEPATHDDIWRNFLQYRPSLSGLAIAVAGAVRPLIVSPGTEEHTPTAILAPLAAELETNHLYAAAMCRVHYLRAPARLPANAHDILSMAHYWKRWYNTEKGRGTVEHFIEAWDAAGIQP